jgi:hypothetical protein
VTISTQKPHSLDAYRAKGMAPEAEDAMRKAEKFKSRK